MSVNITPALIAGAQVYNAPLVATPINTCKSPTENAKVVPMTFTATASVAAFYADLSSGNPPPLSQVASIYVDAINSTSDVTILFPDTGYQFRVTAGNQQLVPAITGTGLPKFYVIFGNNTPIAGDTANVFLFNIFIPEFGGGNFINAIIANVPLDVTIINTPLTDIRQTVQPVFFSTVGSKPGISGNQCFLSGLSVFTNAHASDGTASGSCSIEIYDDAAMTILLFRWFFTWVSYITAAGVQVVDPGQNICCLNGLNIISSLTAGAGNSKFYVKVAGDPWVDGEVNVNLIGGTLVA